MPGDLVDYGPNPAEVVEFVRSHAAVIVRGNHDHAVAFDADPHCSPAFREMALATLEYTRSVLSRAVAVLVRAPADHRKSGERDSVHSLPCHHRRIPYTLTGLPIRRPGKRKPPGRQQTFCSPDTHKAFTRSERGRLIVNPGSLGQPKQGGREARYAVWDDGIDLRRYAYPIDETIAKIGRMPVPPAVREDLIAVLESGGRLAQ